MIIRADSRGVTLRAEVPDDREAIREVVYAAFLNETHRQPGAPPTEHLIIDALREAGALTISLVAEQEGRVVGHIAFSPVRIDGVSAGWYGLGPIAVEPSRRSESEPR